MKIRTCFVSNSSSSSFVLASKLETTPKVQMMIEFELNELIDRKIKTVKELENYIIQEWGWKSKTVEEVLEQNEYLRDDYEEYLAKLKEGYTLYFGTISGDDGGIQSYLYYGGIEMPKIEGFETIEGWNS